MNIANKQIYIPNLNANVKEFDYGPVWMHYCKRPYRERPYPRSSYLKSYFYIS